MAAGLRDLHVFCTETELHLLCMLLDRNDIGYIDYNHIATGLSYIRSIVCAMTISPTRNIMTHFDRSNN